MYAFCSRENILWWIGVPSSRFGWPICFWGRNGSQTSVWDITILLSVSQWGFSCTGACSYGRKHILFLKTVGNEIIWKVPLSWGPPPESVNISILDSVIFTHFSRTKVGLRLFYLTWDFTRRQSSDHVCYVSLESVVASQKRRVFLQHHVGRFLK